MPYVPKWEPLAASLTRVTAAGSSELQAKIDICNAIADEEIRVRLLVDKSATSLRGEILSGGQIAVSPWLTPDDFDWVCSRPHKPWRTGPTGPQSIEALWGWEPRPIALIELATADVASCLCQPDKGADPAKCTEAAAPPPPASGEPVPADTGEPQPLMHPESGQAPARAGMPRPVVTDAVVREWYEGTYIPECKRAGKQSSEVMDWNEAKLKFGDKVRQCQIRSLRRELAPPAWRKQGRRPATKPPSAPE